MPGSAIWRWSAVIASEATTKNQPPDMLIIMFQTRPGTANGNSRRQNRCQAEKPEGAARLVEIERDGAQRLVEAERHVPRLAGEDRKDRRQFEPQHPMRREPDEEDDGEGKIAEHRHRLQNVEQRNEHDLGPPALGGERSIDQREQERGAHRREHAQHRAHGVFRQTQADRARSP